MDDTIKNFSTSEECVDALRFESLRDDMSPILKNIFDRMNSDFKVIYLQIKLFDSVGNYIFANIGANSDGRIEDANNWNWPFGGGTYHMVAGKDPAAIIASNSTELCAKFSSYFPEDNPKCMMMWQWISDSSSQVQRKAWDFSYTVGRDPQTK